MRTANQVQSIARSHGANIYLTGGAIRDILTGFPIRDLNFTVQDNPLSFQEDLQKVGGIVDMADSATGTIHAVFNGIGLEISMARSEVYEKPGKPSSVTPATINEDLRRRDFTCNSMALSLNEGSRGLLLDPFNGAADIEARLLRVLHTYAFLEEPSRLIRAIRFATRFGWEMDERTQARYQSARENDYIKYITSRAIGYEIEKLAREENPIAVMQALENEGWLKVLNPKWTVARANVPQLADLLKLRSTMAEYNIRVNAGPAILHFLTLKLGPSEVSAVQRLIPHREFVAAWKHLDPEAKQLSKKLISKEASLNSGAWKILSETKPEGLLYLAVTKHNKTVEEKIKNFFGKWRHLTEKLPLAQMAELRITPQLPQYARVCQEAFLLLLDGHLRGQNEIMRFLAPFEPPPPPPPPTPLRRGRTAAKRIAAAATTGRVDKQKPAAVAAKASKAPAARSIAAAAAKSPAPRAGSAQTSGASQPSRGKAPAPAAKATAKGRAPDAKVKKTAAKTAASKAKPSAAKQSKKAAKKTVKKAVAKRAAKKTVQKKAAKKPTPKKAAKKTAQKKAAGKKRPTKGTGKKAAVKKAAAKKPPTKKANQKVKSKKKQGKRR
jgi:tRNA nucleotidyltransferase (CCA-adding enzyme)